MYDMRKKKNKIGWSNYRLSVNCCLTTELLLMINEF